MTARFPFSRKFKCKVTLKTKGDNLIRVKAEHNHPPCDSEPQIKQEPIDDSFEATEAEVGMPLEMTMELNPDNLITPDLPSMSMPRSRPLLQHQRGKFNKHYG
jgi:hypothetical protein